METRSKAYGRIPLKRVVIKIKIPDCLSRQSMGKWSGFLTFAWKIDRTERNFQPSLQKEVSLIAEDSYDERGN
jgi:hypothetical protein